MGSYGSLLMANGELWCNGQHSPEPKPCEAYHVHKSIMGLKLRSLGSSIELRRSCVVVDVWSLNLSKSKEVYALKSFKAAKTPIS